MQATVRAKPVIPRVSDGVVYRVLSKLLLLDGERLSYRTLAVEQIGSVYEAIMGFELRVAEGKSIAIKPAKKHGAPATINLEELLQTSSDKRLKWFKETTDQKLMGQVAEGLESATTIDELLVALDRKIAKTVTPNVVPPGAMVFQPSNERRRSGSHYTPSSLTGPIVEAALAPVLKQLGDNPKPAQILALRVCDPAMGSGAFLVETSRQLGDSLMKAWRSHDEVPVVPPDEEEALHAQRVVAQRCLYGVDKNHLAVDLAKLSLWLATLAKDHPFTFLDHSLRHGDSLVGLTRKQIAAFNWQEDKQQSFLEQFIRKRIERVSQYRQRILAARDDVPYAQLTQELGKADETLQLARQIGDTVIAAFFSADKHKAREETRLESRGLTETALKEVTTLATVETIEAHIANLRRGPKGIVPFHWELEFPEVFTSENRDITGGFDAIVGNPPFMSGTRISEQLGMRYFAWLTSNFPPAGHLCDLVAYFFRRSFQLLRTHACFGLIATNTIAQGDTREGSLAPILGSDGRIYSALRRLRWPGDAAVVVSCVHVSKALDVQPLALNGKPVKRISAFLLDSSVDTSPHRLASAPFFSAGSKIYGQGFVFDDRDPDANPTELEHRVVASDSRYASRILPYIGGEEVNTSPSHQPNRTVIFLSDIKNESELNPWPMLRDIVRAKVKPERDLLGDNPNNIPLKRRWWAYQAHRPELYDLYAHTLNVFEISTFSAFSVLQSRPHEIWARFLASSMKDDLRYTASDCFETFPFPKDFEVNSGLDQAGRRYYEFRAAVMVERAEGLTKIYNRFNDPEDGEKEIVQLRELHDIMDRAVLDAYGWVDIQPKCRFAPEFEDDAEEDETEHPATRKYRYLWPDEIRDKVLARLLELNRQRALQEGQVVEDERTTRLASKLKPNGKNSNKSLKQGPTPILFAADSEEV